MTSCKELTEKLKEEKEVMADDLAQWKKNFENLEAESRKLFEEMKKEVEKKDEVIEELSCANEELKSYIDCLSKSEGIAYQGKKVSEVKKKSRTLKCFISRARIALWFAESFGLDISSMNVVEKCTGTVHTVSLADTKTTPISSDSSDSGQSDKCHGFNALSDTEKEKVEEVLFLLDKFYVSDEFYHEITMLHDSLPRSYLVKQRRDELNKLLSISKTPGKFEGCQVDFHHTLTECLEKFIAENPDFNFDENPVKIKFSADGAKMTRSTNFIILSLAVLDDKNANALQEAFHDVFDHINNLNQTKQVKVGDRDINVEVFLGGDYKFLLMVLGLLNATSNHSCVWCKIHKDNRWDMSYDLSYYNSAPLKRTIEEVIAMAGKANKNYCCARQPLLHIDLDHVVVDELHLMLRIVDVLIDNLIEEVLEWDKMEDLRKKRNEERGIHLNKLISTIRSCGVSFNIWQKTNADGKMSGKYECTSLLSNDKKILLNILPAKLRTVIHEESCNEVIKIWEDFHNLYKIISKANPTSEDVASHFENSKAWVELFVSLSAKRKGYTRARVTPYMHTMVYHLPRFISLYKTVKLFSGQGVEMNNDVARSVVLRKSNKWDCTSDVLKLESRQRELSQHERQKRAYEKEDEDYWQKGILEKRQQKRTKSV